MLENKSLYSPCHVTSVLLGLNVHSAIILFMDVLSLCSSSRYTVTLSDCYVTLWLPTASTEKVRTRTIRNSKNPVWNEAFCYKIDRRIKVVKVNGFHNFLCADSQ